MLHIKFQTTRTTQKEVVEILTEILEAVKQSEGIVGREITNKKGLSIGLVQYCHDKDDGNFVVGG